MRELQERARLTGASADPHQQALKRPPKASARHQRYNLIVLLFAHLVPLAAVVGVLVAALAGIYPSVLDISIFLVFFLLTMIGLEIGYHRYFAHGAFRTSRFFERVLAVLGSTAFHGGVIWWTATHKRHHAFSDIEGDPHSPHLPPRNGGYEGFAYGHVSWMFDPVNVNLGPWSRHVLPLYQDRFLFLLNRYYFELSLAWLLIPAAIGGVLGGSAVNALSAFVWGGLVRVFLANHAIYSLNSFCHMMGSRDFDTKDESRNNPWLSLVTLGGSWHNNHHAFPRTATNRLRWWEVDIAAMIIFVLERLGVVWDVYRPSKELIASRRITT